MMATYVEREPLLHERALTIRADAAWEASHDCETRDQRLDLLAEVVWPSEGVLRASLVKAREHLDRVRERAERREAA